LTIEIVDDPSSLADLFAADRATHLYGLPDLEEPFWSSSTWFRSGVAVVGIISTGAGWVTGYAMSRSHPEETLRVLAEVHDRLPPGAWVTGPLGLHETISRVRETLPKGVHHRMILSEHVQEEPTREIIELGPTDLQRLVDLRDADPEGMFFLPMMLSHGMFVGVEESGSLVAAAGTHVTSESHSIAAVGSVITHPDHRGSGLGWNVVVGLCRRLQLRYHTIGLNVAASNTAAKRIYDKVGFRTVFDYEEIQVL
jgi:ribosomal protein S18 acetylase RimI-like enzyme